MGLMGRVSTKKTPSRKKSTWYSDKQGGEIEKTEFKLTRVYANSAAAGTSVTLYTCPQSKKARLLYYFFRIYNNSSGGIGVAANGIVSITVAANESFVSTNFFGYDTGIEIRSGETVTVSTGAGSLDQAYASVVITEEEASDGFYTHPSFNAPDS